MTAIDARASSPPITVPIAADHSTTMLIVKSQKPTSLAAAGGEKSTRTATKLEKANGQMRRGLSRPATAAPATVMNAIRALKGDIRMLAKSTLRRYSLECPFSTRGGRPA